MGRMKTREEFIAFSEASMKADGNFQNHLILEALLDIRYLIKKQNNLIKKQNKK